MGSGGFRQYYYNAAAPTSSPCSSNANFDVDPPPTTPHTDDFPPGHQLQDEPPEPDGVLSEDVVTAKQMRKFERKLKRWWDARQVGTFYRRQESALRFLLLGSVVYGCLLAFLLLSTSWANGRVISDSEETRPFRSVEIKSSLFYLDAEVRCDVPGGPGGELVPMSGHKGGNYYHVLCNWLQYVHGRTAFIDVVSWACTSLPAEKDPALSNLFLDKNMLCGVFDHHVALHQVFAVVLMLVLAIPFVGFAVVWGLWLKSPAKTVWADVAMVSFLLPMGLLPIFFAIRTVIQRDLSVELSPVLDVPRDILRHPDLDVGWLQHLIATPAEMPRHVRNRLRLISRTADDFYYGQAWYDSFSLWRWLGPIQFAVTATTALLYWLVVVLYAFVAPESPLPPPPVVESAKTLKRLLLGEHKNNRYCGLADATPQFLRENPHLWRTERQEHLEELAAPEQEQIDSPYGPIYSGDNLEIDSGKIGFAVERGALPFAEQHTFSSSVFEDEGITFTPASTTPLAHTDATASHAHRAKVPAEGTRQNETISKPQDEIESASSASKDTMASTTGAGAGGEDGDDRETSSVEEPVVTGRGPDEAPERQPSRASHHGDHASLDHSCTQQLGPDVEKFPESEPRHSSTSASGKAGRKRNGSPSLSLGTRDASGRTDVPNDRNSRFRSGGSTTGHSGEDRGGNTVRTGTTSARSAATSLLDEFDQFILRQSAAKDRALVKSLPPLDLRSLGGAECRGEGVPKTIQLPPQEEGKPEKSPLLPHPRIRTSTSGAPENTEDASAGRGNRKRTSVKTNPFSSPEDAEDDRDADPPHD